MPEIPSIDPCENLRRELDKKIHAFEQQGVLLKSQATDVLKDALDNFGDPPSSSEALAAGIAGATVDDVGAGLTAMTRVKNFAGSCLDSIFNEARVFSSKVDASVNDRLTDFTSLASLAEFDLLTPLQGVTAALGGAGLTALLAEIDGKLGCLADSEIGDCTSLVSDFSDRVSDVLSYLGLGADATFDLDDFIDTFSLTVDADVLSNLKGLDAKVESLKDEARANLNNILPQNVSPANYF